MHARIGREFYVSQFDDNPERAAKYGSDSWSKVVSDWAQWKADGVTKLRQLLRSAGRTELETAPRASRLHSWPESVSESVLGLYRASVESRTLPDSHPAAGTSRTTMACCWNSTKIFTFTATAASRSQHRGSQIFPGPMPTASTSAQFVDERSTGACTASACAFEK